MKWVKVGSVMQKVTCKCDGSMFLESFNSKTSFPGKIECILYIIMYIHISFRTAVL